MEISVFISGEEIKRSPKSEFCIKDTMLKYGETNASLAEKLSISPAAVSQMVNGTPSLQTIYKIACAMDIDPREFFYATEGVNETKPNVVMKPEVTCPYCSKRFTLHNEL